MIDYKAKVSKRFFKSLLFKISKKEKQFYMIFFQKKRILKKLKIKSSLSKNGILKFQPAFFEATHNCYVSHVVFYADKLEIVRYTFKEDMAIEKGGSLTMNNLSFQLN